MMARQIAIALQFKFFVLNVPPQTPHNGLNAEANDKCALVPDTSHLLRLSEALPL